MTHAEMTAQTTIRKRDRLKRLLRRPDGAPRRRARLALYASIPAIAVAGFAPAEPVAAGEKPVKELTLRVGADVAADAVPVDLSVLAEPVREALTPVAASYYGPGFEGRPTANGDTFDPSQMTAAHRNLPFGTMVEVTNVSNGKTVTVRINDRGPFHGDRKIDLSEGAADAIGMKASGTGMVTLNVIS